MLVHNRHTQNIHHCLPGLRCLAVDVRVGNDMITLVSAHLNATSSTDECEPILQSIRGLCTRRARQTILLGVGSNCQLQPNLQGTTGPFITGVMTPKSALFLDLLQELDLQIPSTYFARSASETKAHVASSGALPQIDFLCCSKHISSDVISCAQSRSTSYVSDHFAETMTLRARINEERSGSDELEGTGAVAIQSHSLPPWTRRLITSECRMTSVSHTLHSVSIVQLFSIRDWVAATVLQWMPKYMNCVRPAGAVPRFYTPKVVVAVVISGSGSGGNIHLCRGRRASIKESRFQLHSSPKYNCES